MAGRAEHLAGLLALGLLTGCAEDPVPKPRAYFRIDLPEQEYRPWQGDCYGAELPAYAQPVPVKRGEQPCWTDLRFPGQRATVHLTYQPVQGRLRQLIEDAHGFKRQHEAKALKIVSERMLRDSARVYGTLFDVEGDVASPMVFYLTDSTDHFLYGALYFRCRPNADSLAPVTARLREDIRHFAGTLSWE